MPVPPRPQHRPVEYAAPGTLYASPDAPAGYCGFVVMGNALHPILRLEVAEASMSDEVWRKVEELREAIARTAILKLVG